MDPEDNGTCVDERFGDREQDVPKISKKLRKRLAHMLKHQAGIHVHHDYILSFNDARDPHVRWKARGLRNGKPFEVSSTKTVEELVAARVFADTRVDYGDFGVVE